MATEPFLTRGFAVWLTGLPCSGKTTLAAELSRQLSAAGHPVEALDGDLLRKEISSDLGFSKEHRDINIGRAAYIASLLSRNGVAVVTAFVSPYRKTRLEARARIEHFIEVHVRCPLEVCEKRDVKGMYRLAREGKIKDFTGVSDPYEEPESPEVVVDTDRLDLAACVEKILAFLESRGLLLPRNPFPQDELLTRAFDLAAKHHRGQSRQGGAPYLTHPVAVARMVRAAGYPAEAVAAALLHDVLEDSGCEVEQMERVVGPKVTALVLEVTDRDKGIPWVERKELYAKTLSAASKEALGIACADKTHNLRCLAEGFEGRGDTFAKGFSARFADKLANYRRVYGIILAKDPACPILPDYRAALERCEELAKRF